MKSDSAIPDAKLGELLALAGKANRGPWMVDPFHASGEVGGKAEMLVDSRQLHVALGVGAQHRHWITRRLEQHPCVEGVDYLKLDRSNLNDQVSEHGGDRRSSTCALTLRLAKLIAMAEHTPAGDRVRDYFLECERRALAARSEDSDEALLARCDDSEFLLKIVARKTQALLEAKLKIAADAPKVQFAEAIASSKGDLGLMDFGKVVSKTLKTGPRKIIDRMVDEGILFRRGDKLRPDQDLVNAGYFRLIEGIRIHPHTGEQISYAQTVITGRGQDWLFRRWSVLVAA